MSGNSSMHVWVEDSTHERGGYWTRATGTSGGAAGVSDTGISSGLPKRRRIAGLVGTRESRSWTTPVKEITVHCFQEAAGTANLNAVVGLNFDAASDLFADEALVHVDNNGDDNMETISVGETRTFFIYGNGITRIDAIRLFGSEALGLTITGGE